MVNSGIFLRSMVGLALAGLASACGQQAVDQAAFRGYDLQVTHPAPYSTYVAVAPGTRGARLPRLRELNSRAFNRYLMAEIGCSVDPHIDTHVVGDPRVPAGYMVPISCVPRGI
ncbi:MAG: hypothetical protein AAF678_03110 [Pseudomonadota bacterium]